MANPMMQMLRGSESKRPNNPIAMMAEFRKFAANMTPQRALDGINANIDAKFAALEKSQLEGRIAQLEQANNQLYMREQLCGVVRYPTGYTYNAGPSPFCGCNSGCGGNI